ncbi:agamous-like MADS-box protein AGL80 [Quillaja saponaria]|uniref:Agamous-like MADS-box protein AGL80 n=1 Tax=Quillaja saponaria TaxID=32244 RepID=A0AAD7VJG7_QUISA|nr:agamous-like MADS-box protein AGL80 [Quillaja saponaria]
MFGVRCTLSFTKFLIFFLFFLSTMTRGKVKFEYIASESARKATFKKRKKGMMKKLSELMTLCGVDACAIVFGPYESGPDIWPQSPLSVQRVLNKFKKLPEMEQSKRMFNQESFIKQRIIKTSDQLKKQNRENRENQVRQTMFQCLAGRSMHDMSFMDLNDLAWTVEQKMKEISRRIESIERDQVEVTMNQLHVVPPSMVPDSPMVLPPNVAPAAEEDRVLMNGEASKVDQVLDNQMTLEELQKQPWFKSLSEQQNIEVGMDEVGLLREINNQNPFFASLFQRCT